MFEFTVYLLFYISTSASLNYDIEHNKTIGNWALGPQIRSVIPLEPPGFLITFSGVRPLNVDDPVIGYKLAIEKLTTEPLDPDTAKREKIKNVDDVMELFQRKVNLAQLFTAAYTGSPFEVEIPVIHREYMYRVVVVDVQQKIQYSVTVQAYTKALEGPVSKPARGYIDGRGRRLFRHPKKHGHDPVL